MHKGKKGLARKPPEYHGWGHQTLPHGMIMKRTGLHRLPLLFWPGYRADFANQGRHCTKWQGQPDNFHPQVLGLAKKKGEVSVGERDRLERWRVQKTLITIYV